MAQAIEETGYIFHPLAGPEDVSNNVRPDVHRIMLFTFLFNIVLTNCGFCFAERLKQYQRAKKKGPKAVVVFATAATGAAWLYSSITIVLQHLIWWRYPYTCWLGINICAVVYASTKLLLYLLFIEKVRQLNLTFQNRASIGMRITPLPKQLKRSQDYLWQANIALMSPYSVIAVLMLVFQVSKYERFESLAQTSDVCTIGLWVESSLPLLLYDFFFTFFLTAQLYGGCKMVKSEFLQRVAKKNFKGSAVASIVSLTNILTLAITNKNGMTSEMCFAFCAIDVFVNIRTVHYVMSPDTKSNSKSTVMNTTTYGTKSSVNIHTTHKSP